MSYWNSTGIRASPPNILSIDFRGSSVAEARERPATRLDFARRGVAQAGYRVLLAHDLSARSEIAFVRAARLTLEREGHLTILHVIDSGLPASVIAERRAHAQGYLEAEVRKWLARRKLAYRVDVGVGETVGAIAARAQANDVDLVVTGRRRPRRFTDAFAANTVERLSRQIERPTLIVGNSNQSPYRRILVPLDFTDAAAARVKFAACFLPGANLHLLHTYKPAFRNRVALFAGTSGGGQPGRASGTIVQELRQTLSRLIESLDLGGRPVLTISNGDSWALVREELARKKTDLLVAAPQAVSSLSHAAWSSYDMLVLPDQRADVTVRPAASGKRTSESAPAA